MNEKRCSPTLVLVSFLFWEGIEQLGNQVRFWANLFANKLPRDLETMACYQQRRQVRPIDQYFILCTRRTHELSNFGELFNLFRFWTSNQLDKNNAHESRIMDTPDKPEKKSWKFWEFHNEAKLSRDAYFW